MVKPTTKIGEETHLNCELRTFAICRRGPEQCYSINSQATHFTQATHRRKMELEGNHRWSSENGITSTSLGTPNSCFNVPISTLNRCPPFKIRTVANLSELAGSSPAATGSQSPPLHQPRVHFTRSFCNHSFAFTSLVGRTYGKLRTFECRWPEFGKHNVGNSWNGVLRRQGFWELPSVVPCEMGFDIFNRRNKKN